MGIAVSREACGSFGYVRIVRAGGKVDRYNRPVTAHEVMMKNPRHCVTRAEVFRSEFDKAIIYPEEVLMPGEKYFLVPYHTVRMLFKRQGTDKTEFTELLSPLSSVYRSPARIPRFRKTFVKKSPRKNWPRKSPARTPTRKFKDALQTEELEKRCSRKKCREEEKQRLLQERGNGADPLRPRRTLADHLQASPILKLSPPSPKISKVKFQDIMQDDDDQWEQSSVRQTPREPREEVLRKPKSAGDEGDVAKTNAELLMLIDSAQAFLSARRPYIRGGRSPTSPLSKAPNMAVRRRRAWVPRLQTLHECSPE